MCLTSLNGLPGGRQLPKTLNDIKQARQQIVEKVNGSALSLAAEKDPESVNRQTQDLESNIQQTLQAGNQDSCSHEYLQAQTRCSYKDLQSSVSGALLSEVMYFQLQ